SGDFISAFNGARDDANEVALEASPIYIPLRSFLEKQNSGEWSGTATDLLTQITLLAPPGATTDRLWPKKGNALSGLLKRLLPNLRAVGVIVQLGARTGQSRTKIITIRDTRLDTRKASVSSVAPSATNWTPGGVNDLWTMPNDRENDDRPPKSRESHLENHVADDPTDMDDPNGTLAYLRSSGFAAPAPSCKPFGFPNDKNDEADTRVAGTSPRHQFLTPTLRVPTAEVGKTSVASSAGASEGAPPAVSQVENVNLRADDRGDERPAYHRSRS